MLWHGRGVWWVKVEGFPWLGKTQCSECVCVFLFLCWLDVSWLVSCWKASSIFALASFELPYQVLIPSVLTYIFLIHDCSGTLIHGFTQELYVLHKSRACVCTVCMHDLCVHVSQCVCLCAMRVILAWNDQNVRWLQRLGHCSIITLGSLLSVLFLVFKWKTNVFRGRLSWPPLDFTYSTTLIVAL